MATRGQLRGRVRLNGQMGGCRGRSCYMRDEKGRQGLGAGRDCTGEGKTLERGRVRETLRRRLDRSVPRGLDASKEAFGGQALARCRGHLRRGLGLDVPPEEVARMTR